MFFFICIKANVRDIKKRKSHIEPVNQEAVVSHCIVVILEKQASV